MRPILTRSAASMTDTPLSLRILEAADIDDAATLVRAAFGLPRSYEEDLKRHLATDPESWWLGRMDGVTVGMAGLSDYGTCAHVGLMVVHPGSQGKGIGGRIMRHILAAADERKIPMLLLDATPAGHPLYLAQGFIEEDKGDLFIRTDTPTAAAILDPTRVRQAKVSDLTAIAALDHRIVGADRSRLIKYLLAEFPARAFVSVDGQGEVSGYLFAQAQRIGPWLATQSEDAEALLAAALDLEFRTPPEITAPQSNAAARPMLERHGFLYKRSTRHMRRGGQGLLAKRTSIYGYASFALG